MKVIAIIPARYGSTRLPGKPLSLIKGKPMIQWTYESVSKSKEISEVLVATDHQEIMDLVQGFGGNVVLTSEAHQSGTDRCKEAYDNFGSTAEIVINVQGDEPFIPFEMIDQLVHLMKEKSAKIGTLCEEMASIEEVLDPNKVKVVFDENNKALYFSRQAIPYQQKVPSDQWLENATYYKHIGMYGFAVSALKQITSLPVGRLEKLESLEQLRWLENGCAIFVGITKHNSPSVDTKEDLDRLN